MVWVLMLLQTYLMVNTFPNGKQRRQQADWRPTIKPVSRFNAFIDCSYKWPLQNASFAEIRKEIQGITDFP
jgi:hypothetical protein